LILLNYSPRKKITFKNIERKEKDLSKNLKFILFLNREN